MISVVIVEDNDQFRQALEGIINTDPELGLTGSFSSAEKALLVLPDSPPDIIIADISLPGMSGIELIVRLTGILTHTQFMVCSIHDDDETIFEALKNGASGYLLKDPVTGTEITQAIKQLHKGGSPMSPYIARRVIESFQKTPANDKSSLLTEREKEVLRYLAKGLLYKEIAEKMEVTHETVKKHLKNIYQKLHVQNKIEALNKFRLL